MFACCKLVYISISAKLIAMTNQKDGLQGLVVLTGALLCQLIVGGISLSSGIFYVMYREAFNSTPVVTSWLCSLPATLWFMSGIFVYYYIYPKYRNCLPNLSYTSNKIVQKMLNLVTATEYSLPMISKGE